MNLLVVRHAIAEDSGGSGRAADARRPLTPEGRRRMRRGARGLREIVAALDVVATSPLLRAVETAEIVVEACGPADLLELSALAPGADPGEALEWLRSRRRDRTVALVGHEPHLSRLTALLLSGDAEPTFSFRKGGAAMLELDREPGPGAARLRWLATPSLLRKLGANG